MRCKCCDSEKARKYLGDYYCKQCASAIYDTISDDRLLYEVVEYTPWDNVVEVEPWRAVVRGAKGRKTKVTLKEMDDDRET